MARDRTPVSQQGESSSLMCHGSMVALNVRHSHEWHDEKKNKHEWKREYHKAGKQIKAVKNNRVQINPAQTWDDCWRCHGAMGCPYCAQDPICAKCLVVTDREWFIENGPLSNVEIDVQGRGRRGPPLSIYPDSWQRDYLLAHPDWATVEDEEFYRSLDRQIMGMARKTKMPGSRDNRKPGFGPTNRQLEANRNAQVATLAAKSDWNNQEITDADLPAALWESEK